MTGALAQDAPSRRPGKRAYLVRAVYYSSGDWAHYSGGGRASFSVYILKRRRLVSHFGMVPRDAPMHRDALVVLLKEKPREVYPVCSGAE